MICKNCGKNNLDIASFCEQCGEPITYIAPQINKQTSYAPPVQQAPQFSYEQPVNPPAPNFGFDPIQTVKPSVGKGQIIASFVLAILFTAIPSIVLSALALHFKGKYESALKYNDISGANSYASKIKIFVMISWIVLAVTAFILILQLIFTFLMYFGMLSEVFNDAFSDGTLISIIH